MTLCVDLPNPEMDGERTRLPLHDPAAERGRANDLESNAMHEIKALGASELALSHEYKAGFAYWAGFLNDVIARGLPHERFVYWDSTASNLDALLAYATHSSKLSWG